jgi:hypothetical protein
MNTAVRALVAGVGLAIAPAAARATWSILLVDTRTGEIAVGSATCLTNFDLRANTPVLIPGIGGATAQSFVDSTGQNRVFIRDRLSEGVNPTDILTQLATFDSGHQTRQYGIVDTLGRTATFSGTGDGQWAGGRTGTFMNVYAGQVGPVAYAIQGNVLTGQPVVDQAVLAAVSAPGDLPAKLMAAMQAARLMGGDGRCSCSPSAPTSCGSPPPSFTKSAHIAYMLIARAGDREGSNGIYRAGSQPLAVTPRDLNNDGRPELIVCNTSSNNISIFTNTSNGAPFPRFSSLPANFATGAGPRGAAVADFDGDTILDIVTADSNANTVSLLRGQPGMVFQPPMPFPAGTTPRALATANLDGVNGSDLAVACFGANGVAILLNDGLGHFSAPTLVPTDAGPNDVKLADVVGSAALDLVVAAKNANRVDILRGNGDGTFVMDQAVTTSATPIAVAVHDFDGDGLMDIAVACDSGQSVQVFHNTGSGFTMTSVALGFIPTDLGAAPLFGGARPDLLAAGSIRFATLANNGAGVFTLSRTYTFAGSLFGAALADLDGDGDSDAAFANPSLSSMMTVKNIGPGSMAGVFNDGAGCATGDYFMNFNIAFQSTTSPDPVIQLQGLYDQWRIQLIGRPDAVETLATISPPQLPSVGGGSATLTMSLRDWQGQPLAGPVSSVTVEPAPGSPALATIGPVVHQSGGIYTVQLGGGSTPGVERFRIRVDDGIRPLVLMPDPALSIFSGSCYANCDGSTGQPLLTVADFTCFLNRFAVGDPYANCDGGTAAPTLNIADFACYINQFAVGCP